MNTFNEMVQKIAAQVRSSNIIEVEDIPNIDLYMDQVTTFMDKCLAQYKRYDDDKVLTKTMINNYTKAKIFPAPVKKKYSRTHLMLLIMIYHLKSVLSIKDIGILEMPYTAKYVMEHYCVTGRFTDKLYVGVTNEKGVEFIELPET